MAESVLYGELAEWWPLISPVVDYADEAATAGDLLDSAAIPVREVLELGSGGGHNAHYLAQRFAMTLVDLSPAMLAVSQTLNPRCIHHVGDMRTLRLGRVFDAVFIHDAIDYLTALDDLHATMATVVAHLRPGGVAVLMPDDLAETFVETTEHGGSDAPDGRGARFLEWTWDPDPSDSWIRTEYLFVLRDSDGAVRTRHETHRTGLFPREAWMDVLTDAGLSPLIVTETTDDDRPGREIFVAHRPSG